MLTDADIKAEFDRLRGRVLGAIESWNLEERHENGVKQLYKALTYDAQARLTAKLEDTSSSTDDA